MEPEFYSRYAELERTHWWFAGRREILLRVMAEHVDTRDGVLLDFGCGTGGMLPYLERFGRVFGVDGDERAVEFCHRAGREDVRHVLAGAPLPFDDESFDVVTTFDVLEHAEDDVGAVRELRRVLRPGGKLIAAVPAFQSLWGDQDEISRHFRRYRAKQLARNIESGGLRVEWTTYFNTILFPPIAAVRIARRGLRAPSAEKTDFTMGGERLNAMLTRVFQAEAPIVARRRLPFGVSVLAVAVRD